MNFKYLKEIKIGKDVTGYLTKPVDFIQGYFDENGTQYGRNSSVFTICYPKSVSGYSYEDFLSDFFKILENKGHLKSENIVVALTYVFLKLKCISISTEKAWSNFYSNFTHCKAHFEFTTHIKVEKDRETLKLKDYDIGRLDVDLLKSKIKENTISDYWERFTKHNTLNESILSNTLSIRRIEEKISVLKIGKLFFEKVFSESESQIFDLYFSALSDEWFKHFWKDLEEQLIVSVALGGAYYSPKMFLQLSGVEGIQLSVYTYIDNHNKNGWVIPMQHRINEMLFDAQLREPELNEKIASFYSKFSLGKTEFSTLIKIAIQYIGNGTKHLQDDKVNEAFIYYWIALDTILNNDTSAQSNQLKNRVAALTSLAYGRDQSTQYTVVNKLYKRRSAYIHSGQDISREEALLLRDISQIVLEKILNMHVLIINKHYISYIDWLKNIDFIIEFSYKKVPVSETLLNDSGILP